MYICIEEYIDLYGNRGVYSYRYGTVDQVLSAPSSIRGSTSSFMLNKKKN